MKAVRLKSSGQSVGRRMIYGGKDLWNRCVFSRRQFTSQLHHGHTNVYMLFTAGSEDMPVAMSHKDQGRIVYVYEPTLGNFVRIVCIFYIFVLFISPLFVPVICSLARIQFYPFFTVDCNGTDWVG